MPSGAPTFSMKAKALSNIKFIENKKKREPERKKNDRKCDVRASPFGVVARF